jgi:hypothetical protein
MPECSGLSGHNEQTPILRVPLQTGLRFHSRGYEQPPHQRACGVTNSRWLAGDRSTGSDNDLRLGRQDSCSDGLRANAAAKKPSLTSPHGGREPAIKAKEPEVRSAGGTNGLVGGSNHRCGGKPHQRRPPLQHRRQQPPAHGTTAAPWLGSSNSPSPAWLEDASSAELPAPQAANALLPQSLMEGAGRYPCGRWNPGSTCPPPQRG